jgi:hypothetical protein
MCVSYFSLYLHILFLLSIEYSPRSLYWSPETVSFNKIPEKVFAFVSYFYSVLHVHFISIDVMRFISKQTMKFRIMYILVLFLVNIYHTR